MNSYRHIAQIAGACAIAAVATACGGNSGSSAPTSSATTPSGSATPGSSSPAGAVAAITTNWVTFFSASTPVPKRVMLLQDGSQFPKAALAATGFAAQASAKVQAVTNVTASQATVKYAILLAGAPALPHETGTAVYQNGTWKVGLASFCALLKLENGNKTSGLPAPCASGG
jgi:hypothetical protein